MISLCNTSKGSFNSSVSGDSHGATVTCSVSSLIDSGIGMKESSVSRYCSGRRGDLERYLLLSGSIELILKWLTKTSSKFDHVPTPEPFNPCMRATKPQRTPFPTSCDTWFRSHRKPRTPTTFSNIKNSTPRIWSYTTS
jgi:hypothetical protein